MSKIREEFRAWTKNFFDPFPGKPPRTPDEALDDEINKASARFGAKWALEYAAKFVDSPDFYTGPREKRAERLRQLAKQLEEDKT